MCGCFSAWRISAGCWSGGIGEVDDLDVRVLDQRLRRVVDRRDAPALGDLGGIGLGARGDGDDREAGLLVGGEMALGHDHAGADAADPVVPGRGPSTSGSKPSASAIAFLPFRPGVAHRPALRPPCPKKCTRRRIAAQSATRRLGRMSGWPRISARSRGRAGIERHHGIAAERLDLERRWRRRPAGLRSTARPSGPRAARRSRRRPRGTAEAATRMAPAAASIPPAPRSSRQDVHHRRAEQPRDIGAGGPVVDLDRRADLADARHSRGSPCGRRPTSPLPGRA